VRWCARAGLVGGAMRILVADEDARAALRLRRDLERHGLVVDVLQDGAAVNAGVEENDYDVVLLDWLLAGKRGIDVCRDLRERGVDTPILMFSAKASVADRVAALDSGADDHLVKPVEVEELLARIRALLRRGPSKRAPALRVLDLVFDPASRVVRRGDRRVELTAKEEEILDFLIRRAGQVVTRASMSEHVWRDGSDNLTNLVDVHVSKMRRKLDGPGEFPLIQTVRGRGFRLGPEPSPAGRGPDTIGAS